MRTDEQRNLLEAATARYEEALPLAAGYLAGRGFSEETALSFRLGVVDDPQTGDEQYRGRLSIPYITPTGIVGIRFRCMVDHDCKPSGCTKYLQKAGARTHLYNVSAFPEADDWIGISEGELDSAILRQCGIPAVGVPGATNWKPHYSKIFEDYRRVYTFADGDKAGREFGDKLSSEIGALTIGMPDGHDVNSAYMEFGEEFLRSKIEELQ